MVALARASGYSRSLVVVRGAVTHYKKCKFQAALIHLDDPEKLQEALATIASDKKVAKATHVHIAAWRVCTGSMVCGYDDCGESGAGKRLLQLLEKRNEQNCLVAVTRWYGGKHLGGARFRQIVSAANDLLTEQKPKC